MRSTLTIPADTPRFLRTAEERLVSYNIEMTEVTGGTFWKEYTPAQIEGTEPFRVTAPLSDFTAMGDLMQYYPPIDLYDFRLRQRARALGPAWVRVSGSWATKTYYDLEETTHGIPPKGYASVLSRSQWLGVLDFVKNTGGKLLISISNCEGDHPNGGPLDLTQTKKIFDFSHACGKDIDAAEFMNEPNMGELSGAPKGYTAEDFVRDQNLFYGWVKKHYPRCLLVGPCTLGDGPLGKGNPKAMGAGIGGGMQLFSVHDLMHGTEHPLDVFSYHYYNGVSERLAALMPEAHWSAEEALSDAYLSVAQKNTEAYLPLRDRYAPGAPLWVTESGDAGGGGTTWASTFADVFRTLNELGSFAALTEGVIFHNTLASSDYGWLRHGTFEARPNYFAVLLWTRLMGEQVFDASPLCGDGYKVYCHERRKGEGLVYLVINHSETQPLPLTLPREGQIYLLTADRLRAKEIRLNGIPLSPRDEFATLPPPAPAPAQLPPASCAFLLL